VGDSLSILSAPDLDPEPVIQPTNPVDQARQVFRHGNRFAALFGFLLGGFVPVASYTLIHYEAAERPLLWILIAGGLIYSAISVYTWAKLAFQYTLKALGFVVLLEGIMTFGNTQWLSLSGLGILILLNGISAAMTLQKPLSLDEIIQPLVVPAGAISVPEAEAAMSPARKAWATRRARAANSSS